MNFKENEKNVFRPLLNANVSIDNLNILKHQTPGDLYDFSLIIPINSAFSVHHKILQDFKEYVQYYCSQILNQRGLTSAFPQLQPFDVRMTIGVNSEDSKNKIVSPENKQEDAYHNSMILILKTFNMTIIGSHAQAVQSGMNIAVNPDLRPHISLRFVTM
jgi:hypothetical protein